MSQWIVKCSTFHYPYYRGPKKAPAWAGKQAEAKRYGSKIGAHGAALKLAMRVELTVVRLVPRQFPSTPGRT